MIRWTPIVWKGIAAALALLVLGALMQGYATPLMAVALDTLSYCF